MLYMLDNYDSFVYNLAAYLSELGQSVLVRGADEMSLEELDTLKPKGIILSPGPGRPEDAQKSKLVLRYCQNKVPILGVCLGHQVIAHTFGAIVEKGTVPMHGKVSTIWHDNSPLFSNLPKHYKVTRYHSLQVNEATLPDTLKVTAKSDDNVILGIQHVLLPIYGVQFHPEALLTEYGHELLDNFCKICERWEQKKNV